MAQDNLIRSLRGLRGTLDLLVVVPSGAVTPTIKAPKGCKVWAFEGQVVNGPGFVNGGGAELQLQHGDGTVAATMEFDVTGVTPTPDGLVDANHHEFENQETMYIVKEDDAQEGWVFVTVGFDLTQVGPVPPL